MVITATDVAEGRVLPRALAGATVLQIVASMRDEPAGRTALVIAHALVRAGARAIIASGDGPLVERLRAFGGEWLPYAEERIRPGRRQRDAERLDRFLAAQRIDLVHAKTAAGARSAIAVKQKRNIALVTDLPDLPRSQMRVAGWFRSALSAGDRVITRSLYNAGPMIALHNIAAERIVVIPHSVDAAVFHPSRVSAERVAALRHEWGIPSGVRVALIPGALSPRNGQIAMAEAAQRLAERNIRNVTFVFSGDDRKHRAYAFRLMRRARQRGVAALFRLTGECPDPPAAYAAADVVVLPFASPPLFGRAIAEAQSMARPVITTDVGSLPENLIAPPRMPVDVRTGWVVPPRDPAALAVALEEALALDPQDYRALAARAHQFGELMFGPGRVAAATLDVYKSLLADDG